MDLDCYFWGSPPFKLTTVGEVWWPLQWICELLTWYDWNNVASDVTHHSINLSRVPIDQFFLRTFFNILLKKKKSKFETQLLIGYTKRFGQLKLASLLHILYQGILSKLKIDLFADDKLKDAQWFWEGKKAFRKKRKCYIFFPPQCFLNTFFIRFAKTRGVSLRMNTWWKEKRLLRKIKFLRLSWSLFLLSQCFHKC